MYRLQLDFYHPWTNSVGFFWLRERGLRGAPSPFPALDIRVQDAFRGDALDALAEDRADLGISYPNRVLQRVADGLDLVVLAALNQAPLESVTVLESQPLSTFADLSGKRIGFRQSLRMPHLIDKLATKAGLSKDEYEKVEFFPVEPMPYDLVEGRIDAMFGALWAWEGLQGKQEGVPVKGINIADLGAPRYPAQVLVTTRAHLEAQPELVNFAEALGAAYSEVVANPEEAIDLMHEAVPFFRRELIAASFEELVPLWNAGSHWGKVNAEPMREYSSWLQSVDLQSRPVEFDQIFLTWSEGAPK